LKLILAPEVGLLHRSDEEGSRLGPTSLFECLQRLGVEGAHWRAVYLVYSAFQGCLHIFTTASSF
jgi:hypothetical protein